MFKVSYNTVDLRGMCVINPSSSLPRARPKKICQKRPAEHQCKARSDGCSVLGAAWLQRHLQGTSGKVPFLLWVLGEREMVLPPWRKGLGAGGEAVVEGHMACAFCERNCFQSFSEPRVGELCLAEPCGCTDVFQGFSTIPLEA